MIRKLGKGDNDGPLYWFNEKNVKRSMAKYEFNRRNYEKAAKYCEEVLDGAENDFRTRILLSKCQTNTFQPELARKNHSLAEKVSPRSLSVRLNKADVEFDGNEFERSLEIYSEGAKRRAMPRDFEFGAIKASQVVNDSIVMKKGKYALNCLGNTALRLEKLGELRKPLGEKSLHSTGKCVHRTHHLYYLKHLNDDRQYLIELMKYWKPDYPFFETEKKMKRAMDQIIHATDTAETQLRNVKLFYVHKCQARRLTGKRLATKMNDIRIENDTKHLQMAKYVNMIIHSIMNNECRDAKQKTRLMISYMEKNSYCSPEVLDVVYLHFGMLQYLLFRNVDKWNAEKNHERTLVLLGATNKNSIFLQESLFGSYDLDCKIATEHLANRIETSSSVLEKIYSHFEIAKYKMRTGALRRARVKSIEALRLAKEANCHTWIVNLLVLIGLIEFRLNNESGCRNNLNRAIEIARTLQIPEVITFLEKVLEISFGVEACNMSSNDKKKMKIINLMPNLALKMEATLMLRRTDVDGLF